MADNIPVRHRIGDEPIDAPATMIETAPAAPARIGPDRVRPVERGDLERVARLFLNVFRGGAEGGNAVEDAAAYMERLYLEGPYCEQGPHGFVQIDGHGDIGGFLGILKTRYRIGGDALSAGILSTLMAARGLHLPALACGFIAVGALAAMTGALHEDGLGDTADGFFGGATPERRLAIMKDSRIGTFAALALVIWPGVKASLLASIIERAGPGFALLALVASEAASRAAMLAVWHALPSARPGGLSDNAGRPLWESVVCGCGLGLVILIVGLMPSGGIPAIVYALALTAAALTGFAKLCLMKICGQTGDTLGAAQQIGAVCILAGLVMAL